MKNEIITSEFIEAEVREAIFQMDHNKSPWPDSFPAEFYQVFRDTIKGDLMALSSKLPFNSLNFGTIILLPKCNKGIKI